MLVFNDVFLKYDHQSNICEDVRNIKPLLKKKNSKNSAHLKNFRK